MRFFLFTQFTKYQKSRKLYDTLKRNKKFNAIRTLNKAFKDALKLDYPKNSFLIGMDGNGVGKGSALIKLIRDACDPSMASGQKGFVIDYFHFQIKNTKKGAFFQVHFDLFDQKSFGGFFNHLIYDYGNAHHP